MALVGAGGKTTTMLRLAADLHWAGLRTLVATTTKIWPPQGLPVALCSETQEVASDVRAQFRRVDTVALGHHIGDDGKLWGVEPDLVCKLVSAAICDVILCEADGAAGRSVKAHGPGEPIVPPCATHVLVVVGVDAVGEPVDGAWIHRPERFCRLTGARPGEEITADHIARSLLAASAFVPPGARLTFLLSKVDDPARRRHADAVALALRALAPGKRSVMIRQGSPITSRRRGQKPSLYSG